MPDPVAFRIGPIEVRWYGIMIMLGVIVASYIAFVEARRRKEDPDHVWQLFPWVLVSGIVGARIGWVLASLGTESMRNPINWFKIWEGGLSIQGAVIGGALAVWLYCRRYKLAFLKWGDIIAPGLALAQAIGRWGNFFNQEAFGQPTDLPWGIPISNEAQVRVTGHTFPAGTKFHPTFAYEMIWDLLNFGLLMWLGRQKRFKLREGDVLWVYIIVYSIGRILVEAIRVDSAMLFDFKTPQIFALVTLVFGIIMLGIRHKPGSRAALSEANLTDDELATLRPRRVQHVLAATSGAAQQAPRERAFRVRRVPATVLKREQVAAPTPEGTTAGE